MVMQPSSSRSELSTGQLSAEEFSSADDFYISTKILQHKISTLQPPHSAQDLHYFLWNLRQCMFSHENIDWLFGTSSEILVTLGAKAAIAFSSSLAKSLVGLLPPSLRYRLRNTTNACFFEYYCAMEELVASSYSIPPNADTPCLIRGPSESIFDYVDRVQLFLQSRIPLEPSNHSSVPFAGLLVWQGHSHYYHDVMEVLRCRYSRIHPTFRTHQHVYNWFFEEPALRTLAEGTTNTHSSRERITFGRNSGSRFSNNRAIQTYEECAFPDEEGENSDYDGHEYVLSDFAHSNLRAWEHSLGSTHLHKARPRDFMSRISHSNKHCGCSYDTRDHINLPRKTRRISPGSTGSNSISIPPNLSAINSDSREELSQAINTILTVCSQSGNYLSDSSEFNTNHIEAIEDTLSSKATTPVETPETSHLFPHPGVSSQTDSSSSEIPQSCESSRISDFLNNFEDSVDSGALETSEDTEAPEESLFVEKVNKPEASKVSYDEALAHLNLMNTLNGRLITDQTTFCAFRTILWKYQNPCVKYNELECSRTESGLKRLWALDSWDLLNESADWIYKRYAAEIPSVIKFNVLESVQNPSWKPHNLVEAQTRGLYEVIPGSEPVRLFLVIDIPIKFEIDFKAANLVTNYLYHLICDWIGDILPQLVRRLIETNAIQFIESCLPDRLSYLVVIRDVLVHDSITQARVAAMDLTAFLKAKIQNFECPPRDLYRSLNAEMIPLVKRVFLLIYKRCILGTLFDMAAYTDKYQQRVLGSSRAIINENGSVSLQSITRLTKFSGPNIALVGSDWNHRPSILYSTYVWEQTLCVPLDSNQGTKVFFDASPYRSFLNLNKAYNRYEATFGNSAPETIPKNYIGSNISSERKIPKYWVRGTAPVMEAFSAQSMLDDLFDATPSVVSDEAYKALYAGLCIPYDSKSAYSFIDENGQVLTRDGHIMAASSLNFKTKVYCPQCETIYHSNEYGWEIPIKKLGRSSAVVLGGKKPNQLAIKCWDKDCLKVTQILCDTGKSGTFKASEYPCSVRLIDVDNSDGFLEPNFNLSAILETEPQLKLIAVDGPSGTGKSTAVFRDMLRPDYKLLVVSHRRQLASSLAKFYVTPQDDSPNVSQGSRSLDLAQYTSLSSSDYSGSLPRLSICINSVHKLEKNGTLCVPANGVVVFKEAYSIMEQLSSATLSSKQAMHIITVLKKIVRSASKVVIIQHNLPPRAIRWYQKLINGNEKSTVCYRVTTPISLVPAYVLEVSESQFNLALTGVINIIRWLYVSNIIQWNSGKIYIPCCDRKTAYAVYLALLDVLFKQRTAGNITAEEFTIRRSKVKVIDSSIRSSGGFQQDRRWLDEFITSPGKADSSFDILIATPAVQLNLSLPSSVTNIVGIFPSRPVTFRNILQQLSRLRTDSGYSSSHKALLLVEKGVTSEKDITQCTLHPDDGDDTAYGLLRDCSELAEVEAADSTNRLDWLLRTTYKARSGYTLLDSERCTIPPGIRASKLNTLTELYAEVMGMPPKHPIYWVNNADMCRMLRDGYAMSRNSNLAAYDILIRNTPWSNPLDLVCKFPVFLKTGVPPSFWVSDTLQYIGAMESDGAFTQHVERSLWDISKLMTCFTFSKANAKADLYSNFVQKDVLFMLTMAILYRRSQQKYSDNQSDRESALNEAIKDEYHRLVSLPEEETRKKVEYLAELAANSFIAIGVIDVRCHSHVRFSLDSQISEMPQDGDLAARGITKARLQAFVQNGARRRKALYQFMRWNLSNIMPLNRIESAVSALNGDPTAYESWWSLYEPKPIWKGGFQDNHSLVSVSIKFSRDWVDSLRPVLNLLEISFTKKVCPYGFQYSVPYSSAMMRVGSILARDASSFNDLKKYLGDDFVTPAAGSAILIPMRSAVICGTRTMTDIPISVMLGALDIAALKDNKIDWLDSSVAHSITDVTGMTPRKLLEILRQNVSSSRAASASILPLKEFPTLKQIAAALYGLEDRKGGKSHTTF